MKPRITISALDAARLESFLATVPARSETHHDTLLEELARADIVEPQHMPPGVATMNSSVRFAIDAESKEYCMTLCYPKDMPHVDQGISILTPIGTALLGLSVGDAIDWPRPDGQLQTVRLLDVLCQPEQAGEHFR